MMRVVIDARKIGDFGIGTYIRGLVEQFARRPDMSVVLLGDADCVKLTAQVEWIPQSAARYGVSELTSLRRSVDAAGADLFHAPHYVYPLGVRTPGVVTIHDCIHLRHIEQLPRPLGILPRQLSHQYAATMMRHAGRAARRVITVSEASRADLVDRVGIASERIDVIPNGVDAGFGEAIGESELRMIRQQFGLPGRYVLFVGNAKPHKNLPLLVAAYQRVRRRVGDIGLVVVGTRREAIPDCPEGVVTPGYVGPDALRALYQCAAALAMPSLIEGFGLPVLEAMCSGTPVVAADTSSLPEVVGDAGLLVDPRDVGAWVDALDRVLTDRKLQSALAEDGRRRAAEFTWARAADATIATYRRVLAEAES